LKKYEYLITFQKVKREFRNEKILMLFILYFLVFRSELTLENISYLDLEPNFESTNNLENNGLYSDGHINQSGHHLFANSIIERIK
jgi:hypothetical protein